MKPIPETGTKGLLLYLKRHMPRVYERFAAELSETGNLQGFGAIDPVAASSQAPPSSSLADTIAAIGNMVAQGYLTVQQQRTQSRILDAQLKQAQAGKPPLPIDPTQYGLPAPAATPGSDIPWGTLGLVFGALLGIGLLLKGTRRTA